MMDDIKLRQYSSAMLPEPTAQYAFERVYKFDADPRYHGADKAVGLVFRQWPTNTVYEQILVKVVVLNRLYNTNIYDPYSVARHILGLSVDSRLEEGDSNLVGDLSLVSFSKDKTRNFYSFATKYCSWHQPAHFQIYDGYVDWLLWQYRKQFGFMEFRRWELREYPSYLRIVKVFQQRFGMEGMTRKQLDKFLWIEEPERGTLLLTPPPTAFAFFSPAFGLPPSASTRLYPRFIPKPHSPFRILNPDS